MEMTKGKVTPVKICVVVYKRMRKKDCGAFRSATIIDNYTHLSRKTRLLFGHFTDVAALIQS